MCPLALFTGLNGSAVIVADTHALASGVIVWTGRERKPRDGTDSTEGDTDGEPSAWRRRYGHHIPLGLSSVPAERALTSTCVPGEASPSLDTRLHNVFATFLCRALLQPQRK